jgi:chromosome segregation ATPase
MSPSEYQQLVDLLEQRFAQVDQRFAQVDERFAQVDRRFVVTERRFNELDTAIAGVRQDVADLRHDMLGHFDAIYLRLEGLEQEYQAIIQGLRRIEMRLGTEGERRERLERDLADLRRQVEALQGRLGEMERRLGD